MANLGSLDLATTLKESAGMLICARLLLDRVVQCTSLPRQDLFREIIEFMIGELERCVAAAHRTQSLELASGTRKLFELSLFVDYLCTSDANTERFMNDAAIDQLDIMKRALAIDKRASDYLPDEKLQAMMQALQQQIDNAGLTGQGPLMASKLAQDVDRKDEYDDWYKIYSKMSHATAWAIHGKCHWERMVVLLLRNATSYAAKCCVEITRKTGLQSDPANPTV